MKKRLIAILLLMTMLFTQLIPTEVVAAVGNQLNTAIDTSKEKDSLENPFMDVQKGSWYYDAVQYARINKFFSGTSANKFDPDKPMSRGMFVAVLGRMAGVDQTKYAEQSAFSDVKADDYYAPFIAWASKHGIAMGNGNGKFNPNDIINREEMAVFFVRYFETFDVDYDTRANITTIPKDIDTVSPWAQEMVLKMWKTGLLSGDGVNYNPKGIASRAQASTLCMRTDKVVDTWYREPGVPSTRVSVDPEIEQKPETLTPDSSTGKSNTIYYKVTFVNDSVSEEQVYTRNTLLSTMPNPAQPIGKVFLGWYYDNEKTKPVNGDDRLNSNITLYANFSDAVGLDEGGTPNYVSALNQEPNFSIVMKSEGEPILGEYFKFKNITAPDKTPESGGLAEDDLNVETVEVKDSGNGLWTISASASAGFTPGHTYQIELINDEVIYDDHATAFGSLKENNDRYDIKEVRFFNFSIEKNGTLNLKLDDGIKYIKAEELNFADREGLMEYAGLYLASTDSEGVTTYTANNGSGSFTYTGKGIQVGDIVAIYEGTKPTERKPEKGAYKTKNDDVSYVKITGINGSTHQYVAAEAEDVLFTPDVLPIDIDAGDGTTKWTLDGSSVRIDNDKLNFSTGYEKMGLNAETSVDVGDYLAFYTGVFGQDSAQDEAYGEILTITVGKDSTTITYREADESEIMSAMDLYDETQLTEGELEKTIDENKEEIQRIIEAQLKESDFFDDAGEYLAELALQTDEVRDVFGDKMTMSDCVITYADGTPIGADDLTLMGNIIDNEQDGKKPNVSVSISPRLSHFNQNLSGTGLRVEVAVNYNFKIQKSGSNKFMEVSLTAFFEQEVTIGFSVSGGAVWKKKWIFPYIADYRMNGNLDLGTYTGIGVTATAKLTEDKEPWGMPWPSSVKEAAATKKIFSLSESIKKKMEEIETVLPEKEASASGGLAEKYAAFMDDANEEWVDLITVQLINLRGAVDPLHILAYGLQIDFVVSANLNVAIGMTFQYENFKRHSFSLTVKSKSADSNSVDLSTNGYQFDFYVMGTLGIRAGIRAKATIGLFSTKLAGIGLQIEAGAYARLWGYFYYHLGNWKIAGKWEKESGYSGALLIEIGSYLDVKFIAEALNGKYSYAPTIYAKEWPLWSAGQRENIYDFAYDYDPTYSILNVNTYTIPSVVYDMLWMDLKTGELEDGDKANTKNFDTNTASNGDDEARFVVELSNPNFSYNPVNNQITINNISGEIAQSCNMKITWKGAPLSGSSEVLSRTITLNWSNEANAATIEFESKGGSAAPMLRLLAGTDISNKMTPDPTKLGYTFGGWYTDENLNNPFITKIMPAGNTKLYAKWIPNTVSYTIEHYQQALDGQYALIETDNKPKGTVGNQTSAVAKNYTGFTAQVVKQQYVAADGSTQVAIYYDRNSYDLEFDYDNGSTYVTVKVPYGSTIVKPLNPVKQGYTFIDWNGDIPETMPAKALNFKAQWTEKTNTTYMVKHIREDLNGNYPESGNLVVTESLTGITGQNTNAVAKTYTGFTSQTIKQQTIAADGSTALEIKYARNSHNLTWNVNEGDNLHGEYTWGETKYGTTIIKPETPTRNGYIFVGWYRDEGLTTVLEENATMPDKDLTLYVKWISKTDTAYTVKHIRQNLDESYPTSGELVKIESLTGIAGQSTSATAITYTGFTAQSIEQKEITSDGNTVVEILYTRNSHKLTWDVDGGNDLTGDYTSGNVKYGTAIKKPITPTHSDYYFVGWYKDNKRTIKLEENATMPDSTLTLYAKWSDRVNIGDMEITKADVTDIQKKFDDILVGTATVTNKNGTIIIKLLKDITGRINFNASGRYILNADGHTFSGGLQNEAILINHNISGVTLELVGNGTYNSGTYYVFFISGGSDRDNANTLIIKSATINGTINASWYDPTIQIKLEDGYEYFTVKNNGTNLYDETNTETKTISDRYIDGTGTGLVVEQHR